MTNPEVNPKWLTQGETYLLPKFNETNIPKNYRPITCLPIMYKILTSITIERTYNFLDNNNILLTEQKGCKRGSCGCKGQLQDVAGEQSFQLWKPNYCEDRLLLIVLELYKVSPTIINVLKISMTKWKTNLHLNYSEWSIICENFDINSGIF